MLFIMDIVFTIIAGLIAIIMDIVFTIIAGLIAIIAGLIAIIMDIVFTIIGFRKGCLRGIDGCRKITKKIWR